jgi:catechol 2,3-dioxygenase-like lactoylglutathione lyase family enzyme
MPPLDVIEEPVKFHLSLNVPDLGRAVEFYRVLFGVEPAKRYDDYAKFELDDPPVVFSLAPHPPGPGASLSHVGLRVSDDAAIARYRDRLEAAGICTQPQDGTTCGHRLQNKLWVKDPFGTLWDIYRVEGDEARPAPAVAAVPAPPPSCATPPPATAAWEHYVGNPVPDRVPHADGSLDEVRLTGTFNADITDGQRSFLVAEAFRVLKPGGQVVTHGLMGDRPLPGLPPKLPGLAAMVARVPCQTDPLDAFRRAGFVGARVVKYTEQPWFTHGGVGLREVKLAAWKPGPVTGDRPREVVYKGPFARATADGGHVFDRGRRVTVSAAVWDQLRLGPTAEQFLFQED